MYFDGILKEFLAKPTEFNGYLKEFLAKPMDFNRKLKEFLAKPLHPTRCLIRLILAIPFDVAFLHADSV